MTAGYEKAAPLLRSHLAVPLPFTFCEGTVAAAAEERIPFKPLILHDKGENRRKRCAFVDCLRMTVAKMAWILSIPPHSTRFPPDCSGFWLPH